MSSALHLGRTLKAEPPMSSDHLSLDIKDIKKTTKYHIVTLIHNVFSLNRLHMKISGFFDVSNSCFCQNQMCHKFALLESVFHSDRGEFSDYTQII